MKTNKMLFICSRNPLTTKMKSGGTQLTKDNLYCLQEGTENLEIEIFPILKDFHINPFNYWTSIRYKIYLALRLLFLPLGFTGGLFPWHLYQLKKKNNFDIIFIDDSLYGRLAHFLKKNAARSKQLTPPFIISHFHNFNLKYIKDSMNAPEWIKTLLNKATEKNEKEALIYSNESICLNLRDSLEIEAHYKMKPSQIIPFTFGETLQKTNQPNKVNQAEHSNETKQITQIERTVKKELAQEKQSDPFFSSIKKLNDLKKGKPEESFFLFCGLNFPPNLEGIQWFIKKVLPKIQGTLMIVGYGMEKEKFNHERVVNFGCVDETLPYYQFSDFVIAPIFKGSGLKTKTIEALKLGKIILGTVESFEGVPTNELPFPPFIRDEDLIKQIQEVQGFGRQVSQELGLQGPQGLPGLPQSQELQESVKEVSNNLSQKKNVKYLELEQKYRAIYDKNFSPKMKIEKLATIFKKSRSM